MEMERQNAQAAAKRLWKVVRIVYYMVKTCMSKSKLMQLDLNLILKRGNKAVTSLHHRRRRRHRGGPADVMASVSCRSDADVISSALVLREYEFSCSNSPANPFAPFSKRKRYRGGYDEKAAAAIAVQRVFQLLEDGNDNGDDEPFTVAGDSPLVVFPAVRVTDSPFPVKDEGGDDNLVDKAAEEFIKRFYKNLKLQKNMATGFV
ncbi:PREDICTED: uncharacterized protein LOC104820041 [Tarenaya hassleriana]|uniref:uncharacterized protein LOC104820041 n=1 Tax=Tarenaya hassleriana TaxID=28532 RepID=UPI00053CA192|nr:PREDICTED: uncharacterized protein LOC104820041 [Tarenaya hassleriana]